MDLSMVDFLWASDEINARPAEYWALVMDVAMKFNLKRIERCTQIMGRAEGADLQASQIFYPCMQCADIFFLKARLRAVIAPLRLRQRVELEQRPQLPPAEAACFGAHELCADVSVVFRLRTELAALNVAQFLLSCHTIALQRAWACRQTSASWATTSAR